MRYDRGLVRSVVLSSPHIEIRGLTKRYGALLALDAVDLTIGRGELFTLVGSSGCGKTTLLRALAGFVQPDSGEIRIGGKDMAALAPYDRPVNMMFQSYALFPHMTVEANIAFGLYREGLRGAEVRQRVSEALDLIQMQAFAGRRPHQLSGGQRQRVALARALVKRPQVLLLDEPLSALDKKLRESTQFELVSIQERLGITFIMVTHDQEEAMTMASRIAVMSQGRIIQIGTSSEIYEHPVNRFVADFVGSVNLFDGVMVEERDGTATVRCALPAPLRAPAIGAPLGAAVCVAIRPERVTIGPISSDLGLENVFEGRVTGLAFIGDRRICQIEIAAKAGETPGLVRATLPNTGTGTPPVARGERVRVGWSTGASLLLRA